MNHNIKPQNTELEQSVLASRQLHLATIIEKIFALPELPQIDRWISLEFAKNKKFGSRDRKWYTEQIFSIVRRLYFILYSLQYANDAFEKFETEINTPKKFWDAVRTLPVQMVIAYNLDKSSQDLIFSSIPPAKKDYLSSSVPIWLKGYIESRFIDSVALKIFLNQQNKRPSLWIRLNHPTKMQDVLADLKSHEFEVLSSRPDFHRDKLSTAETSIAITGTKSLYQLKSFQDGLFEIQDYASQAIGAACDIKPGDYVWDVCAGGGGKTMQIATDLQNKGVVYATDIREYKLEEIKQRAKRAQFFNVRTMPWDGHLPPEFPKEINKKQGFNCVLIDAPCTASGTWRRHPDAKYKTDKNQIDELSKVQKHLLFITQNTVKQHGKLVYATCSIFREENEDVVELFLRKHTTFKLISMNMLQAPQENSDCMFVAVMEKSEI